MVATMRTSQQAKDFVELPRDVFLKMPFFFVPPAGTGAGRAAHHEAPRTAPRALHSCHLQPSSTGPRSRGTLSCTEFSPAVSGGEDVTHRAFPFTVLALQNLPPAPARGGASGMGDSASLCPAGFPSSGPEAQVWEGSAGLPLDGEAEAAWAARSR